MDIIKYRQDVDGLRAIAVLLVVLFHLDFSTISGGFVGVDIFFVISGFVIFRSAVSQLEAGTFSIIDFYKRRIRRIFPALAVAIFLTLVTGALLMTPRELENLAYSALAAMFAVSNIYFSDRLGYFADSTSYIPLIHTWSLGVEEQFYLLAPLIFLILGKTARYANLFRCLLAIFIVSFSYNLFAVYGLNDENHAFYLPMSRLWEIALGGLTAFAERKFAPTRGATIMLFALGLSGIAASAVLIDTNTPFPGISAIVPTFAAVLLILSNPRPSSFGFHALANSPTVFLGKISYSLYLYHWPIIVFYGLYSGQEFSIAEKVSLLVATTIVAAASWKFIEVPVRAARTGLSWQRARAVLATMVLSVSAFCVSITATNGLSERFGPKVQSILSAERERREEKQRCADLPNVSQIPGAKFCSYVGVGDRIDYVLWGDSHAKMYGSQLSRQLLGSGFNGVLAGMSDCPPLVGVYYSQRANRGGCGDFTRELVEFVASERIPVVVLASRWANFASSRRAPGDGRISRPLFDVERGGEPIEFDDALERTVDRLQAAGTRVVIIGPVPEVEFNVPDMLVRSAMLGREIPDTTRSNFDLRQDLVFSAFIRLTGRTGVEIVYPHKILCDEHICKTAEDDVPLYSDDDHLSAAGVGLVLPSIIDGIVGK